MLRELTSAELAEHNIFDQMTNDDAIEKALDEEEEGLAEKALAKAREYKRR